MFHTEWPYCDCRLDDDLEWYVCPQCRMELD